jgi:hypothetical protein
MSRQRCHSGGSGAASKLSSIPSTTSPRLSSCCPSSPPSRFRFLLVAVDASAPVTERHGGRGLPGSGSSADCNDTIEGSE